ncbi:MAG: acylphosphatase [Simkaniaceae bacterium]|nr:acylphosphatase [Candidatus Sacchlamyda saccharinae]
MLELHAIFQGRVQGVGFRASATVQAKRLGLICHAENKSDGTVEIKAQGEKSALEKLVVNLKSTFDVTDVQVQYQSI